MSGSFHPELSVSRLHPSGHFFVLPNNAPLYGHTTYLFIYEEVDRCLKCFHCWAVARCCQEHFRAGVFEGLPFHFLGKVPRRGTAVPENPRAVFCRPQCGGTQFSPRLLLSFSRFPHWRAWTCWRYRVAPPCGLV